MPEIHPTLTGARSAVLARLWGALAREPVPGVVARRVEGHTLSITLRDGRTVSGPAAAAQPFALVGEDFTTSEGPDPAALVRALLPDTNHDPALLPDRNHGLAEELNNSVANLAMARAAQPDPDGGPGALRRAAQHPDPLALLEQSVVDGHPLHPGCRTRLGLSPDEVRAYAPEHRPVVTLRRVEVPADRWYGNAKPVLTVHPWQLEHILPRYPSLRPTDERVLARPLMSLRTLALVDDPTRHVKTAVDVQMTSAVRTVSPAAVHNGPTVTRLLTHVAGRTPELGFFAETHAGAVLVDDEPHRSLGVVYRRMPPLHPGEVPLPLAALFAPSPASGRPIVTEIVHDGYGGDALSTVEALAGLLLPPLFGLLGLGIALEAHGQNVLVVVRDGRLTRLLYRDLGGIRISPRRLNSHGIEAPTLRGDLVSDDPDVLRTKVFASAVSTVLSELVVVLSRELGTDEEKAWRRVAGVLRTVDGPDVNALLSRPWPLKATTAMRLAADPLEDIWTPMPNPLEGLA